MHLSSPMGRSRVRRGRFVVLVGPDGSGKSTLATGLLEELADRFTGTRRFHWRPSILPPAGRFVGHSIGDTTTPHAKTTHGRLLSLLVLLYYWTDFFVGGWTKVSALRRRGQLVVMERGWHDVAVDPRRYRLRVSPRLVFALAEVLPHPDVILVLEAPVEVLRRRKQELPIPELERQVALWREVRFPRRSRIVYVDASLELQDLLKLSTFHTLDGIGGSR
jgi:thymidylate kinase